MFYNFGLCISIFAVFGVKQKCRKCIAGPTDPKCTYHKIVTGSCEDAGFVSIDVDSDCQGAITTLKIKADFHSTEAKDDPLHGCWIDSTNTESPIARFNKSGKQDKDGTFSMSYSEKYTGICKTKECGDNEEAALGDYYLDDTNKEDYCAACDKGAAIVCVALDC